MRDERDDRATCQSKTAYASEQEAEAAGQRARRVGKTIRVYKCAVCGCWHLTRGGNEPAKRTAPHSGKSTARRRKPKFE